MSRIPSLAPVGRAQRLVIGCGIALAVFTAATLLRQAGPVDALELQLIDVRTRSVAGEQAADERILICQVQDSDVAWVRKTLNEPWPWALDYNAFLVSTLEAAGAEALMVDILHLDRGAGPDDLPAAGDAPLEQAEEDRRLGEAASAQAYGDALRSFGRVAVGFELARVSSYELPARVEAAVTRLGAEAAEALALRPEASSLSRPQADLPVLGVLQGARVLGFTNAPADRDGIVRRSTLVGSWKGKPVISLPLATLAAMPGDALTALPELPLDPDLSFVVDFRSRSRDGGYARIEPARLLSWALAKEQSGALPPEAVAALKGKIVILGINIAGIQDVVATPVGTLDGPVFQATVLDNLLNGGGRTHVPGWVSTLFLLLIAFGIALPGTLSANRVGPHLIPLLIGITFVILSYALFSRGLVTDLFIPLLSVFFTWGAATVFRLLTAGRRNKWLEGTFGRYVAPTIIESLKQDPTLLKLGGRKRDITVLFSDVANFTTASEQLGAEKTVALLNKYLTDHCNAVFDNDGIVDKFEGDAVMAFFGDPLPQGDHPVRACRAALQVIENLPKLEPVWREMGLDTFAIRIGLNSGSAFVGNMGSEQRFDYTCMGNTVNVASRIEGANKLFDTEILVGPRTEENARDVFVFKPLGRIQVIGAKEPLAVFELMAERSSASDELKQHVAFFVRALEAVRADDLALARTHLASARALRAGDGPCRWLDALVDELESGYTKRPWDGLTQQRSK